MYIDQAKRNDFNQLIDNLADEIRQRESDEDHVSNNTEENLNYIMSRLITKVYGHQLRYREINDVVGMLECVKQEFYRKVAAPMQDQKEFENGAVLG